ncbi:hypothetical protein FMUAM8_19780 [Nocardia cyriacigeorgica]|uniref:Uncharacterized protein n=3 Tax=Nocardia cyriacigeorgica TaxID=135487 RepID=H6RC74_NOCCG|nr:hypothetical protein FMUAM8_19780 [Nocardia cyriacigeorgica]CCF62610.1 membrane protein of unknown function [Nocardia cyriacigeorgica GUH-2]
MSRRGELGDTVREPVIGFVVGLFLTVVGMFVPLFATDRGGDGRETYSLFALREEGISGVWLLFVVVAVLAVIAIAFPQRFATSAVGTCTMTLTFALVIGELILIAFGYAALVARLESTNDSRNWAPDHTDMLPGLVVPVLGLAVTTACVIAWWSRTVRAPM